MQQTGSLAGVNNWCSMYSRLELFRHQWYWSYQYSDFLNNDNENIEFDSYMVGEDDLENGSLRMLEVDNRLVLPELTHIRIIVTAAD